MLKNSGIQDINIQRTYQRGNLRDCGWTISDLKKLFSVPTLSSFISPQINIHNIKSDKNFILTPSFAKSLFSSKSNRENIEKNIQTVEINEESKSISELIKLEEIINGKPIPFTSQLTVNPFEINNEYSEEIVLEKEEITTDLFISNIEWWQSQYECLRPILIPQSISYPELSRNIYNCRNTIFSQPIPLPSSCGYIFDENKYIKQLIESSCNIWTLMHISCTFYRSFNWSNAHLALLKITTELSGRSRPYSDVSLNVYNELFNDKKTKLLFERTIQHLFWLTAKPEYIMQYYEYKSIWKRYNTIITSLHWIYLILKMKDKQIQIIHNECLNVFIKQDENCKSKDLLYLLSARIEGGLFNKKGLNIAYVNDISQGIFDKLFERFDYNKNNNNN
eukprot:430505_1